MTSVASENDWMFWKVSRNLWCSCPEPLPSPPSTLPIVQTGRHRLWNESSATTATTPERPHLMLPVQVVRTQEAQVAEPLLGQAMDQWTGPGINWPHSQGFYKESWGDEAAGKGLGLPAGHAHTQQRRQQAQGAYTFLSHPACSLVQKRCDRGRSLGKKKARADLKMCPPTHIQHTQNLPWDRPCTGTQIRSQLF